MMKKIRDVVCILDGSSSMSGKEIRLVNEYNRCIEKLKTEKYSDIYITTAVIREKCDLLQLHMPLKFSKKLDGFQYYTYGNTAYYDSIVEVVKLMEELVKERSSFIVSEVVVFIWGDGLDNASIWNTKEEVQELFNKKKEEGWTFVIERNTPEEGFQKIMKNLFT